jgi:hypothetical protein
MILYKKIMLQYLLGISFAVVTIYIMEASIYIFPNIGWGFLSVLYFSILLFQFVFYFLTTNFKFCWTILNFIINFVLWIAELINTEKIFQETYFYKEGKILVLIFGGFLWVTNKLIIDLFFRMNQLKKKNLF